MPLPMPRLAPVTIATLFDNACFIGSKDKAGSSHSQLCHFLISMFWSSPLNRACTRAGKPSIVSNTGGSSLSQKPWVHRIVNAPTKPFSHRACFTHSTPRALRRACALLTVSILSVFCAANALFAQPTPPPATVPAASGSASAGPWPPLHALGRSGRIRLQGFAHDEHSLESSLCGTQGLGRPAHCRAAPRARAPG